MKILAILSLVVMSLFLGSCSSPPQTQTGLASWYSVRTNYGRETASGERFRQMAMTAAHKTLPFDTMVKVTNLKNGKSVKVRINDRGPYVEGRIIDLSKGASRRIGMTEDGVVPVKIEILK